MHRSIVLALAASALPTFVCAQALPFVRSQPQVRGFANDHTNVPLLSPDRVVVRYGKAVSKDALESLAREMPVVLATRVASGPVFERTYGFPGSEIDLIAKGAIPAGSLTGPKASLLLRMLLARDLPPEALRQAIRDAGTEAG